MAAQHRTNYQALSQCAVSPIYKQLLDAVYRLWWCMWRPARLKSLSGLLTGLFECRRWLANAEGRSKKCNIARLQYSVFVDAVNHAWQRQRECLCSWVKSMYRTSASTFERHRTTTSMRTLLESRSARFLLKSSNARFFRPSPTFTCVRTGDDIRMSLMAFDSVRRSTNERYWNL